MLITDFLEDINRFGQEEIEFHLIDIDGNARRLDLCIVNGHYLHAKKDKYGNETNTIILGLEKPDA